MRREFSYVSFSLVFLCFQGLLFSQNIYVSPSGDDGNSGSLNSPKKTIQASIGDLNAGDTLFLRGGSYHEEVVMNGMKGSLSNPIVFKAYMDEVPIVDGTVDLEDIKVQGASWELATDVFPETGNIYKLVVEEDVWQLWVRQPELMPVPNATGGERADYRMQVIARWPNANTNPTDPLIKGPDGIAAQVNTWWSFTTTWAFAGHPETSHTKLVNSPLRFNLAGTGKSFQGGTAIVSAIKQGPANIPVQILVHEAGSDVMLHSGIDEDYGLYSYPSDHGPSYFIQHLNALDSPGEWYYNDSTSTVYLWPEDNSDPNGLDIRGKTQTRLLELGRWLKKNGEAIYGTEPWYTSGEYKGEIIDEEDVHYMKHSMRIHEEEYRYTTKPGCVYVIAFQSPGDQVRLEAFSKADQNRIRKITTLNGSRIKWEKSEKGLIMKPESVSFDLALVYKVELK